MKYFKYLFIFFLLFLFGCSSGSIDDNKQKEKDINLDSLKS